MTPAPSPDPAPAAPVNTRAAADAAPPHRRSPAPLYEPAPWLIVRTPLLPARGPGAATTANPRDALADPRIRRALAIASPDLLEALQRPGASPRDAARAELKLARYLIRMSTRPTPYGAFAAVSLAGWGERTTLSVRNDADRIRTRPDMGWLTDLCLTLDDDPAARADSRWAVGAHAVERHGRLALADGGPAQSTGSVRLTTAVREALRAARRPVPYAALRRHLLDHTGGSPEQVDRLLTDLWRQRLLVTDLRAALTTTEPADELRGRLADRPACARTAGRLADLLAEMADLDSAPADEAPKRARGIAQRAKAVHPADGPAFQTDMARPVAGDRLTAHVGEACAQAAELLLRLSPQPLGCAELSAHRGAFTQRYGHDREVPLLELLDEHTGIGPLAHAHGARQALPPEVAARRANALTDLALGALRDGQRVVELTDALLADLQTRDPSTEPVPAPLSLELSAFVAAASPEAVDRGDFLLVVGPNLGASSAGRSLGRFADLLAPQGPAALRALGEAESRARADAALPAEVVYLPANHRMANVVVRPAVHEHEIVLDVPAGVPAERVVPLDDILVGILHDRYRLRSRRLDAVLRPTARHMLNTHQAPAVCRFLDEVARDGSPEFAAFDWGPAAGFPFLPRVQYGRIVLAPARWLLRPALDGGEGRPAGAEAFAAHVAAWRTQWSVPARLYLTVADNRLLLDLDDPAQVEQLRAEARSSRAGLLVLQEALPDTADAWVPGADGVFMSELVAPLVLRPQAAARADGRADGQAGRRVAPGTATRTTPGPQAVPQAVPQTGPAPTVARGDDRPVPIRDRLRLPGSDWLFAKLYCDHDQENGLLAGPLRHLCEMAEVSGLAQQWFFIRYADPDPHLRLRWKGDQEALTRHLLPEIARLAARLTDEGLVSRLVIDTYDRELERYGGSEGTDVSEQIFCADSRAVMRLLAETGPAHTQPLADGPSAVDNPDGSDAPDGADGGDLTELAAVSTDDLLAGLGLDADERLHWYTDQARQFYDSARRQAGEDYRVRQRRLRTLLGTPQGPALLGGAVQTILAQRRSALAEAVDRLSELEAAGRLATDRDRLLGSYVHLHCNRLLAERRPSEGLLVQMLQRTRKGLSVESEAAHRDQPA
ncbi:MULTISPECIES: lantibiotic dehydratase [unclassified Kitasatospora]|uniref:lantibiotic dehydratase n=1 Tax=unclassified Kitasatospora TaxID=2633591 RepID=UPI003403A86D